MLREESRYTIVSPAPEAFWQHPWYTTARWTGKQWTVSIKPGFVNEWDPVIEGIGEKGADVDLLDRPRIPVSAFRDVGYEDDPIPKFFLKLGVRAPDSGISILGDVVRTTNDDSSLPRRSLRAVDCYLSVARASYQSRAEQIDASGTSAVVVDYSVTYNTSTLDRYGTRPRLRLAGKFPAVKPPTLAERLMGSFQDEGEDRLLISTVFFLSPPNEPDAPMGPRWTPYVQHNLFWNLQHRARNVAPAKDPEPIRLATGLPLADLLGNAWLSTINDVSDRILNAVNNTTPEGKFWTA